MGESVAVQGSVASDDPNATLPLRLTLLGESWQVDLSEYPDAELLLERLGELWGRALAQPGADAGESETFRPQPAPFVPPTPLRPCVAVNDERAFPYRFSGALTRAVLERRAGTAMLFHAAGLASSDGAHAVVLVAPSGMGKSTAARVLGRRFGYLSDELVAVEHDLRVSAYPKPISILVPGFPGGKDERSPDELQLLAQPSAPPVLTAVVRLARDPARDGAPVLVRTGLHDALGELTAQTSSIWRAEQPLQLLARIAVRGGGPYVLRYAEIEQAVALLDDLIDTRPLVGTEWIAHVPPDVQRWSADATGPERGEGGLVARSSWTDAVEHDGEITVLRGPDLFRLSGIGATLWRECAQPHVLSALVEAIVSEHGPHPEAEQLVSASIAELVRNGLLVQRG